MDKAKQTILIVDDTETNIDILLELLSEYDIAVATDGQSALEIVDDEKPNLILLDIMMPEMDGYEVCQRLKEREETKDIPVVFITAKTDEDSIEKAYSIGAMDYVTKPFKPRELLAKVETQLKVNHLIKYLDYIASHDEMTGVYNRRKFFELANDKFINEKENLYAVMIDIDKFKNINDTYGHAIGDEVIKLVANTILENISSSSIFGRIGGEEFAILCNSKENVVQKIEDIREAVSQQNILYEKETLVHFTISEGISKFNGTESTLDELLKEADKALYEAKETGRNKVIFR